MMMIYETRGIGIVLKESRLAVNNDKKQMICLASKRKRAAMAASVTTHGCRSNYKRVTENNPNWKVGKFI